MYAAGKGSSQRRGGRKVPARPKKIRPRSKAVSQRWKKA